MMALPNLCSSKEQEKPHTKKTPAKDRHERHYRHSGEDFAYLSLFPDKGNRDEE
jgi:hypothetical protein